MRHWQSLEIGPVRCSYTMVEPAPVPGPSFSQLPLKLDRSVKQAFYNTGALIFVALACGAAAAVACILEAFLRPLLWAALCGTFLHPFKRALTSLVRTWLSGVRTSGTPLALAVVGLPFTCLNLGAEALATRLARLAAVLGGPTGVRGLARRAAYLCAFAFAAAPVLWLLWWLSGSERAAAVLSAVWTTWDSVLAILLVPLLVWSTVCGYLLVVGLWWQPQTQPILKKLSCFMWAILLLHLASLTGSWRAGLGLVVLMLLAVGALHEWHRSAVRDETETSITTSEETAKQRGSFSTTTEPSVSTNTTESQDLRATTDVSKTLPKVSFAPVAKPPIESFPKDSTKSLPPRPPISLNGNSRKRRSSSDVYFVALLWATGVVIVWQHLWIIQLLPIPLAFWMFKKLIVSCGTWEFVRGSFGTACTHMEKATNERRDALFPTPVRGCAHLLLTVDRKLLSWLEKSLDKIISVFIILFLIMGTLLLALFLTAKFHQESTHIVQVTQNLINETVAEHPEWASWLPEAEVIQKALDSAANNVYQYGREWITSKLQHLLGDKVSNTTRIERQVLDLWDHLYQSWFVQNGSDVQGKDSGASLPKQMVWSGELNDLQAVASFLHENIETFMSILESLWIVMSRNVNLLMSSATTLLTLIFYGGTAILNFILSLVIFLTTLFYLLSSSNESYRPVKWVISLTPLSQSSSSGQMLGRAVEEAIRGVFDASFKMAAFYGIYTWLTHTAFGINVVFIPAVMAACLGAVPFLGTYWAVIPAVLDLWLAQGQRWLSLLLFVCHILPTSCVDTAIYSDISGGGHPYLTGLAVAGGVYYHGLEGAIIGPILLCSLVVAMNVYSAMLSSSSTPQSTPLARSPMLVRSQSECIAEKQ
uniref:transmembrane protein 245 isoform X2 n=1 Tax=Myxine glutinosa TaxID=7769 RepID=UPI00358F2AB5